MKKILLSSLLLTIIPLHLFSLTDQQIEEIKKNTWAIKISVNVPGIYPEALQYTVFENDPLKLFEKHMNLVYSKGGKQTAKDPEMKDIDMSVKWDMIFRNKTGDEIALLPSLTLKSNPFSMRSNSDPKSNRVWIVTKPAYLKGKEKPICWCIPVIVKKGRETSVRIDMTNQFNLEKKYNSVLEKMKRHQTEY